MGQRQVGPALVAVVALTLAGLTAVAIWQAASAHREVRSLRSEVQTLESRLPRANTEADAVAKAERDAQTAFEKATAVEKRLTAGLRAVRRQISGLQTTSEAASAIQECGNKPAGGAWTYEQVLGAGHFNLTARNVSCTEARSVVDQIDFSSDPPSYPGWTCEYVSHEYEFADIRCTSGIKVVRFQTGS
jgi:hypothetical protein